MKKNSLTLSLPEWIDDFLKEYQFPLVSNEERMRFVLKLTLQNIEKTTGGPFFTSSSLSIFSILIYLFKSPFLKLEMKGYSDKILP